ncbi:MAG: hypothetical protein KAJ19_23365, partial [Gammaproteobacteria bacterium]|nr:hypothetical protein [Gammaproteobacteria bacterium]
VDRSYDSSYSKNGAKIGDTLRVRNPNQYTRRKGSRVMDVQDQKETTQNVVVATQDGVDMRFNSAELSLSIDDFSKRYLEPATAVMVAGIEGDMLASVTKDIYQVTGTAGTVVGASADISAISGARAKLNQQLAPKDMNRNVQFDSVTMGSIVNGTQALFHDGSQIKEAFREGFIGRNAMAKFFENEKTYAHTNGSDADVVWAVDDTTRLAAGDADLDTGISVLNFDAMGTAGPSVGTVFTIDACFDVHPETKAAYAHLKQFVVTAVGTVAGNAADITFSPSIFVGSAKQNVSTSDGTAAILEDEATIMHGAASAVLQQNLMYHKDAFTFVTADLPIMDDAIRCVTRQQDGLSIRCWQGSDIRNDELLLRLDILYGFKTLRPEWACRISN